MNKQLRRALGIAALAALFLTACKKDEAIDLPAPVATIETPAGGFTTVRNQFIELKGISNLLNPTYRWSIGAAVVATTQNFNFITDKEGVYEITLTATQQTNKGDLVGTTKVNVEVKKETTAYTKGITRVFEFVPAPGQFVHVIPEWLPGETAEQMTAKAATMLKDGNFVHLGGFGGYVVVGFDHAIINKPGHPTFKVLGNAFNQWSEPGIIEVSVDANKNGKPDDEWYEIAGSEYNSAKTVKNYEITYYKPDENKVPTPHETNPFLVDTTYIRWTDNKGGSGYLSRNSFYSQPYFPQWTAGDKLTFKGTKLTDANIQDLSGTGNYYIHPAFDFGYADNWGNTDDKSNIHLDWAVDKTGKPVKLAAIHFIKVYTGMRAEAGWLGEISTEFAGIEDLNIP